MSLTVLRTKLQMPRIRPTLVLRPRLIDVLNDGANGKATFVSAPAGFGKTTLISAWLAQLDSQKAWLSLNSNDNDLRHFLTYFVLALETIDVDLGKSARAVLDTVPRSFAPDTVIIPALNNVSTFSTPITLVFDDYHEITNDNIHAAVTTLIDHSPHNLHLVFTSREELPIKIAKWRIRGLLTELNSRDLRFTEDESADFLTHVMELELSRDDIKAIHEQMEGWAAGLQIVALTLKSEHKRDTIKPITPHNRYVIDYLAEEVMEKQPAAIRTFLRQTSVCDRFCAPLCDALTGREDGAAVLEQLEQANLFVVALDDAREWYRYHRLFGSFLRSQLDEAERATLHLRASRWFETNGLIAEAIQHATAAQQIDRATQLVYQHGETLMKEGRFTLLLDWVNAMPEEVVRASAVLSARKAYITYLRGEVETAQRYMTYALNAPLPDDPLQRAELQTFNASYAHSIGRFEKAETNARDAMQLAEESENIFHTWAMNILGQAQFSMGQMEAAEQTFRHALTLGRQRKHDYMSILSLSFLAPILYQRGERLEAIRLCENGIAQYVDQWGNYLPMAGLLHVSMGVLQYAGNNLSQAQHHLDIGLSLCEKLGVVILQLVGLRTCARVLFAQNNHEALLHTIRTARDIAERLPNPLHSQQIDLLLANLNLRNGDVNTAENLLANKVLTRKMQIAQARLYLAQGEQTAARHLLQKLEDGAAESGRKSELITIRLLLALAGADEPDLVESAIKLAAPGHYVRLFVDEGAAMATLIAPHRAVAPPFVGAILAEFPEQSSMEVTNSDILTAREREILSLVADGMTNQQIADNLFITVSTTKWYLNAVYRKLDVKNRTKAVAKARELGLLLSG